MVISEEEHEQMPEPVRERLEALKDAPGSVIVVGSMNADYTCLLYTSDAADE